MNTSTDIHRSPHRVTGPRRSRFSHLRGMIGRLALTIGMIVSSFGYAQAQGLTVTSSEHTFYFGVTTEQAGREKLDGLHVDLNISYVGGAGNPFIAVANLSEPDNPADDLYYTPDEAYLYFNEACGQIMGQASIDAGFGFIGAEVGQKFWIVQQDVVPGQTWIYPGLRVADDSEEDPQLVPWNPGAPAIGAGSTDKFVRLELVKVTGPTGGEFTLFNFGNAGAPPSVYMATSDGIDADDCIYLAAGWHHHCNWAFTQPGDYAVTFRMTTVVVEKYDNWLWADGLTGIGFAESTTPAALPNGVRYALGIDDGSTGSGLPSAVSDGGVPGFQLELPEPARPDVTYAIWRTYDLTAGTWSEVATKTGSSAWSAGVETLGSSDAHTLYRWSETDAPAPGQAIFYQLRLTQQ